jgi:hypothetical protein
MDMTKKEKRQQAREQLWCVMHDGRGGSGHAFNFGLVILILISVAIIPLEFLPHFNRFAHFVVIVESIIVALFTVEYLLRVYAAPNRLRYIFSFFGIIDLLSIMPFYAGVFGTEYIRVVRLIRLFKLIEIEPAAERDELLTMAKGIGLIDGERVEHIVTKSPIILLFGSIPPLFALTFGLIILLTFEGAIALTISIVLFFFALIFLWKAWLDYSYDVIYVTNYRLIFQNQHILGRHINQVNYPSITNVKPFYPNPISYIFRYGSLVIDTAAEHPGQIGLHAVRRHEKAAHIIMEKCFSGNRNHTPEPPVNTPEAL